MGYLLPTVISPNSISSSMCGRGRRTGLAAEAGRVSTRRPERRGTALRRRSTAAAPRCGCDGIASKAARSWRRRRAFSITRPTFYHARTACTEQGLAGFVPRLRAFEGRRKLSGEVLQEHVLALRAAGPVRARLRSAWRRFDGALVSALHRRSPRTSSAGKKTAQLAAAPQIPPRASEDYEVLRDEPRGREEGN